MYAIHLRHCDIEEQNVGVEPVDCFHCTASITYSCDNIEDRSQHREDTPKHVGVIVGQDNATTRFMVVSGRLGCQKIRHA